MRRLLALAIFWACCSPHPGLAAEKAAAEPSLSSDDRSAITFGLLQGGSLLGVDWERLVTDRVGFQIGAGLVGFDAGLTYHYRPGIRSRHLYLGYWNLGFDIKDDSYGLRILGLTHVWRSRRKFTAQLGLGARLAISKRSRDRFGDPPVMLLYSIGLCGSPGSTSTEPR